MATRSRKWKEKFGAVRNVLMSEWNPVGFGVPDDEYDSYIPVICRLIYEKAEVEALARHLEKLEVISMGLPGDLSRNRRVAELLMRLNEHWKTPG